MRILLDQNLSPKLIPKLADVLPGLETVYGDSDISAVISADRDFVRLVERLGPPPKVIRIDRCDFPSRVVEQLLRRVAVRIHDFLRSDRAVLQLSV